MLRPVKLFAFWGRQDAGRPPAYDWQGVWKHPTAAKFSFPAKPSRRRPMWCPGKPQYRFSVSRLCAVSASDGFGKYLLRHSHLAEKERLALARDLLAQVA